MKCVMVESPLAGETKRNVAFARLCMQDSLRRGEAPLAGHLLYTQVLDDVVPEERQLGIAAHLAWLEHADLIAVYVDLGISAGMELAISKAKSLGIPVEERRIAGD